MPKRYSIAEARIQLARIVREAERGRPVELTRIGRPVVVLLSAPEYARLAPKTSFREALDAFMERWPAQGDGLIGDELTRGVRAKTAYCSGR